MIEKISNSVEEHIISGIKNLSRDEKLEKIAVALFNLGSSMETFKYQEIELIDKYSFYYLEFLHADNENSKKCLTSITRYFRESKKYQEKNLFTETFDIDVFIYEIVLLSYRSLINLNRGVTISSVKEDLNLETCESLNRECLDVFFELNTINALRRITAEINGIVHGAKTEIQKTLLERRNIESYQSISDLVLDESYFQIQLPAILTKNLFEKIERRKEFSFISVKFFEEIDDDKIMSDSSFKKEKFFAKFFEDNSNFFGEEGKVVYLKDEAMFVLICPEQPVNAAQSSSLKLLYGLKSENEKYNLGLEFAVSVNSYQYPSEGIEKFDKFVEENSLSEQVMQYRFNNQQAQLQFIYSQYFKQVFIPGFIGKLNREFLELKVVSSHCSITDENEGVILINGERIKISTILDSQKYLSFTLPSKTLSVLAGLSPNYTVVNLDFGKNINEYLKDEDRIIWEDKILNYLIEFFRFNYSDEIFLNNIELLFVKRGRVIIAINDCEIEKVEELVAKLFREKYSYLCESRISVKRISKELLDDFQNEFEEENKDINSRHRTKIMIQKFLNELLISINSEMKVLHSNTSDYFFQRYNLSCGSNEEIFFWNGVPNLKQELTIKFLDDDLDLVSAFNEIEKSKGNSRTSSMVLQIDTDKNSSIFSRGEVTPLLINSGIEDLSEFEITRVRSYRAITKVLKSETSINGEGQVSIIEEDDLKKSWDSPTPAEPLKAQNKKE